MKNKSVILKVLVLGIASAMMLTACGNDAAETETSATETATVTTAETTAETTAVTTESTTVSASEEQEETLKTIGKEAEGEGIFAINVINSTDKAITGFAVKEDSQDEFSDNMLTEDDAFIKDEERILYFAADDAEASYTVLLTFEDDKTAELHNFPFDDMESCEIKLEDSMAYLVYTSLESKEEVNTKEDETAIEIKNSSEQTQANEEQEVVYDTPSYEETPQQPATEAQPPAEEEPADTPDDPDSGCIGDEGLFY